MGILNKDQRVSFGRSFCLNISLAILTLTLGTSSSLAEKESPLLQEEVKNSKLSLKNKNQSNSQSNNSSETEEALDFSDTGRSGQQTAGETRSGQCGNVAIPLTALVPSSNSGKTIATHPQLWFYVPYATKDINKIEFVIQDAERNDISRQTWQPQNTPGYLSAGLPKTESALETDKLYRWYFKVYCHDNDNSAPLFVQGWIERIGVSEDSLHAVTPEPAPHMIYAEQNLWFDAIDSLLTLLNSHAIAPNNTEIIVDWEKLIEACGVDLELPELETTHFFVRKQ